MEKFMSVNKRSLTLVASAALMMVHGASFAQPTVPPVGAPAQFAGVPTGAGPGGSFAPPVNAPVVPPMVGVNQMQMNQQAGPVVSEEQRAISEAMAKAAAERGPAPTVDDLTKELTAGGKPRNPLEEVSKLNAEVAALRAKLQIVEIKAQIKKKEEELAPPVQPPKIVYIEKKVESKKKEEEEKKSVDKPKLPPLPDLSAIGIGPDKKANDKPVAKSPAPVGAAADAAKSSSSSANKPSNSGGNQNSMMVPRVVSIEGIEDQLTAELYADWGGQVVVKSGDSFGEFQVSGITPSAVFLMKKGEKTPLGYGVSKASMIQGGQNQMGAQNQMGGMPGGMMGGSPMMNAINSAPVTYPAAFDPANNNGMISTPDGKLVPSGVIPSMPQAGVPAPVSSSGQGVDGLLSGLSGGNLNALK